MHVFPGRFFFYSQVLVILFSGMFIGGQVDVLLSLPLGSGCCPFCVCHTRDSILILSSGRPTFAILLVPHYRVPYTLIVFS